MDNIEWEDWDKKKGIRFGKVKRKFETQTFDIQLQENLFIENWHAVIEIDWLESYIVIQSRDSENLEYIYSNHIEFKRDSEGAVIISDSGYRSFFYEGRREKKDLESDLINAIKSILKEEKKENINILSIKLREGDREIKI